MSPLCNGFPPRESLQDRSFNKFEIALFAMPNLYCGTGGLKLFSWKRITLLDDERNSTFWKTNCIRVHLEKNSNMVETLISPTL